MRNHATQDRKFTLGNRVQFVTVSLLICSRRLRESRENTGNAIPAPTFSGRVRPKMDIIPDQNAVPPLYSTY